MFDSLQNHHSVELLGVEYCKGDDGPLKLSEDFSIRLTHDCYLIIEGCIETTGFKAAEVRIRN